LSRQSLAENNMLTEGIVAVQTLIEMRENIFVASHLDEYRSTHSNISHPR